MIQPTHYVMPACVLSSEQSTALPDGALPVFLKPDSNRITVWKSVLKDGADDYVRRAEAESKLMAAIAQRSDPCSAAALAAKDAIIERLVEALQPFVAGAKEAERRLALVAVQFEGTPEAVPQTVEIEIRAQALTAARRAVHAVTRLRGGRT